MFVDSYCLILSVMLKGLYKLEWSLIVILQLCKWYVWLHLVLRSTSLNLNFKYLGFTFYIFFYFTNISQVPTYLRISVSCCRIKFWSFDFGCVFNILYAVSRTSSSLSWRIVFTRASALWKTFMFKLLSILLNSYAFFDMHSIGRIIASYICIEIHYLFSYIVFY